MTRKSESCFSLSELIIVLVIVAVIAGFAIPSYRKAIQRSQERERDAMIQLLTDAAEIYYSDNEKHINCYSTEACNTTFDLNIPLGTWEYQVVNGEASAVPVSP